MGAPSAPSPSSDASYLRQLLERQPACLIRVRLDGALLACSRGALGLFGVDARGVVSTSMVDRIIPAHRTQWQEFVARCWDTGAASFEGDLVIGNNEARRVLVQGAALKDHADGFESLLLHLCDESQPKRLEQSILSAVIDLLDERQRAGRDRIPEGRVERLEVGVSPDEDRAERRRLTEALDAQSADRQRREAQFVALEKKLEASQLVSLQKEREYHRDVAMLKAALAAAHVAKAAALAQNQELEPLKLRLQTATAEQVRLEALIAEYAVDRTRIAADHRAAVDTVEQSLAQALAEQRRMAARAEAQTRERDSLIADHRRALADMEIRNGEVAALRAEQVRLEALVAEYEIDRTRTAADHQAVVHTLEQSAAQALAEQSRMAARAEAQTREQNLVCAAHQRALVDLQASKDAALADLRSQLARTSAEESGLAERVEVAERELEVLRAEHERAHERLIAEHHRALADVETGNREAVDDLRLQHSQVLADQRRLVGRLEEHERERDSLIAEHHQALADMESGKTEALAELRSQLSQAFADQRRLATRADEQERELDRLRAEHYAALTDAETRNRDVLAELRSELAQTATEHTRLLAERAEEHERERNRISAEHSLAIADLQASKEAAAAELRSQLSAAVSEHHRQKALLEDGDRERERMAAEHRRAIADLQASKHETVAECERVLTEVQQALLVRDASRRVDIERRLVDGIDEAPLTRADGERLVLLQRGLTVAFSRVHAVLKDGAAPKEAVETEHDTLERPTIETIDQAPTASAGDQRLDDADLLREPFDDADDAFVHQLLGGISSSPPFENVPESHTVAPAQAVSATQALTASAQPADDVFDAQDAEFARSLMNTHHAPRESVDEADAEAPQELPQAQPAASEDS